MRKVWWCLGLLVVLAGSSAGVMIHSYLDAHERLLAQLEQKIDIQLGNDGDGITIPIREGIIASLDNHPSFPVFLAVEEENNISPVCMNLEQVKRKHAIQFMLLMSSCHLHHTYRGLVITEDLENDDDSMHFSFWDYYFGPWLSS